MHSERRRIAFGCAESLASGLLKIQWDEWLQDWCIIRQDKNTMAHFLEIRLPFLDHILIEFAFHVPPRLKNNGLRDKIVERKIAAKLLPRQVTHRKKNPFFLAMEFFLNIRRSEVSSQRR
jgi:asparagine synthase (glutamine-hydrolysing)